MNYRFDFAAVVTGANGQMLLKGVGNTFLLFASCWFLAFALALMLVGLDRLRFRPAHWFVRAWVEYHRNVPLIVQLMFWYFSIPQLFPQSLANVINSWNAEFFYALIALSMYSASYISENIRSGLRAIPHVQFEAAEAMGFTYFDTMVWIIIPQAWRHALPALIGDTISLFKGTAIAGVIGVGEITYQVGQIQSATFKVFEIFLVASLIYLAITIPLMMLGDATGRRLAARVSR